MKIENWKRVIHTKEETTWSNIINSDILVQVIYDGRWVINLYNAKNNVYQILGKEWSKNRAVEKAVNFMRNYKQI